MSQNVRGADIVVIRLIEGEEAVLGAHRGLPEWAIEQVRSIPYPTGITWGAIIEGKLRYCPDSDQDRFIGPVGREIGVKSYASMPIHFEGMVVGTLNITSLEKNAFGEEDLNLLEIVTHQIGLALGNARYADELRKMKEGLELRVQERTLELVEINEELKKEITERKRAEGALRESEQHLRIALTTAKLGSWQLDLATHTLHSSDQCKANFGLPPEADLSYQTLFEMIHPDDHDRVREAVRRSIEGQSDYDTEYKVIWPDGNVHWIIARGRCFYEPDGRPTRMVGATLDITERKKTEEETKASLKEKEILLREIHHRVKNNLQIISSLLSLQSRHMKNTQVREEFKESQNRVKTMALIHERLYQSGNLAGVSFGKYAKSLAGDLFRSYGADPGVKLKVDVDDVFLSIDKAIPCGLIMNELVSNSLKYAFPLRMKGEVRIKLTSNGNSGLTLVVGDSGVGLPKEMDFRDTSSLGLQLVNALTRQLNGTVELDRSSGTEFRINFIP